MLVWGPYSAKLFSIEGKHYNRRTLGSGKRFCMILVASCRSRSIHLSFFSCMLRGWRWRWSTFFFFFLFLHHCEQVFRILQFLFGVIVDFVSCVSIVPKGLTVCILSWSFLPVLLMPSLAERCSVCSLICFSSSWFNWSESRWAAHPQNEAQLPGSVYLLQGSSGGLGEKTNSSRQNH